MDGEEGVEVLGSSRECRTFDSTSCYCDGKSWGNSLVVVRSSEQKFCTMVYFLLVAIVLLLTSFILLTRFKQVYEAERSFAEKKNVWKSKGKMPFSLRKCKFFWRPFHTHFFGKVLEISKSKKKEILNFSRSKTAAGNRSLSEVEQIKSWRLIKPEIVFAISYHLWQRTRGSTFL